MSSIIPNNISTVSDYFSVGCRTGKNQLTMILVERELGGVETKQIKYVNTFNFP